MRGDLVCSASPSTASLPLLSSWARFLPIAPRLAAHCAKVWLKSVYACPPYTAMALYALYCLGSRPIFTNCWSSSISSIFPISLSISLLSCWSSSRPALELFACEKVWICVRGRCVIYRHISKSMRATEQHSTHTFALFTGPKKDRIHLCVAMPMIPLIRTRISNIELLESPH